LLLGLESSNSILLDDAHVQNRIARKHLMRKVPGFISVGHVLVFLGFAATLLSVTLAVNWDRSQLQFFGHRLGWYFPHCPDFAFVANLLRVTTALLVFVIFLSLKNTPLAILTTYSYEKLNFFHQVAGYSLIAFTFAHTVVMLVAVSL
jgi:hypothetical protein